MKATVLLLQRPISSTKELEEGVAAAVGGVRQGTSNLDLELGMSVGTGTGGAGGTSDHMDHQYKRIRFFAETAPAAAGGSGFVADPWSLAARQEKAALEQAIKQPHLYPSSSSMASRSINPSPPPSSVPAVVGWPPVRSFRRNVGAPPQQQQQQQQQQAKSSVDDHKSKQDVAAQDEEAKLQRENTMDDDGDGVNNNSNKNDFDRNMSNTSNGSNMFVKVNMEGYAVGRKIDLKAHHCYDSLSRALQKMFHNLLSAANYSNKSKQDEGDEVHSPNYVLLYEDNEGDKMLVGDVPWEMFMSSVKRLYITMDQRASHKCGMLS